MTQPLMHTRQKDRRMSDKALFVFAELKHLCIIAFIVCDMVTGALTFVLGYATLQ